MAVFVSSLKDAATAIFLVAVFVATLNNAVSHFDHVCIAELVLFVCFDSVFLCMCFLLQVR